MTTTTYRDSYPTGCTVWGRTSHFLNAQGNALCGVLIARNSDYDSWVGCSHCMAAATRAGWSVLA